VAGAVTGREMVVLDTKQFGIGGTVRSKIVMTVFLSGKILVP
jgi:hypothetical protein